jgi:CheY-like chemotaxis protein
MTAHARPSRHPLVLIVDDEPLVRLVAADALADAGFEVLEADSADHALELMRSRDDVAVLFTDINMPGTLDGLALAEMVHQNWPSVRIVVTSGRVLTAPVPDDGKFLCKPYTLPQMTGLIAKVSGV